MIRNIVSVIIAYLAIVIIFWFVPIGAMALLGPEKMFKPAVYESTALWSVLTVATLFCSATIAGFIVVKAAKHSKKSIRGLVILILLLGGLNLYSQMKAPAPTPEQLVRLPNMSLMELMVGAKRLGQPIWAQVASPLLLIIGVLLGARIVRLRKKLHAQTSL